MKKLLLPSLFFLLLALFMTGCTKSQTDIVLKDSVTQSTQKTETGVITTQTTETKMTTAQTTEAKTATTQTTGAGVTTTQTTNNKPASFLVSDLTIDPRMPATHELFTVSVTVTNIGGIEGNYDAILQIDDLLITLQPYNITVLSTEIFKKSEIIAAGESKNITFEPLNRSDGTYLVTVADIVDYINIDC